MPSADDVTLGILYHHMRQGLGDSGPARVTVEYQQRSSTAPVSEGRRTQPGIFSKRMLSAEVDFDSLVMARATMTLGGMSGRPQVRFTIQSHGDGHAYSVEEGRWGRLNGRPEVFDLVRFEEDLDNVAVTGVTVEQAVEARRTNEALDIDLDVPAFEQLLRVFSADRAPADDDLDLGAYSVTLAGGEELSLLYWWSLTGMEEEERPGGHGHDTYASKVTCSVSIRLAPLQHLNAETVRLDEEMPVLADVDEIWRLARRTPPASARG